MAVVPRPPLRSGNPALDTCRFPRANRGNGQHSRHSHGHNGRGCGKRHRSSYRRSNECQAHHVKATAVASICFPHFPIGTYDLIVTASGFKTYEQKGIVARGGQQHQRECKLTVGTEGQTVEVQAEGLALQTEDATFKQTIDNTRCDEMPLNGRQMTELITALRRLESRAGRRLYGQQIFLSDNLGFHRGRRWQHHALALRWRRQPGLHGQRQPALSIP